MKKELVALVKLIDRYLQLEDKFYSKRISYWAAQQSYWEKFIDRNWELSPKQAEVYHKNLSDITVLLSKLEK